MIQITHFCPTIPSILISCVWHRSYAVLLFLFVSLLIPSSLLAQGYEVSGTITGKNEGSLPGAAVQLFSLPDSVVYSGKVTDVNGQFRIENVVPGQYFLRASYVGYLRQDKSFKMTAADVAGLNLTLSQDVTLIDAAVVQEIQERVEQKGDTTVYNADAFKTNPDATVEDLLKKMPGIADEQGTLKAQGEEVTKVLVDGKEFFGTDTKAAVKNLPANMVKSIEVFDQQSDQSRFTGVNDGNTTKTINIVTKGGLEKGQFGKLYAGYGTDDRYTAGGNINFFKGNRRIALIGMSNNINQQNFASEDITSMSGVQMGGMSGRGGRWGQSSSPFMTSGSSGINTTHSFGVNYNNEWKKKAKLSSSYFFNQGNNENNADLTRDFFTTQSGNQSYEENKNSSSIKGNHRYNGRLEWTIDTLNTLILTPNVTYNNNLDRNNVSGRTLVTGDTLINSTESATRNIQERWNVGTGLQLQHKFMKPRRTISADLNVSAALRTGENRLESENIFYQEADTLSTVFDQIAEPLGKQYTGRADVSYTEPLGEKTVLQFNYKPSFTLDESESLTFNLNNPEVDATVPDSVFSNKYNNVSQSQEAGLRYLYDNQKWNLTLGGSLIWSWLDGEQTFPKSGEVAKSFFNFLPEMRGRYSITKSKSWGFSYRGSNALPSINQLQNLLNNSNPLQLSTGNENLSQSYTHRLFTRYSGTSEDKTKTFFCMLSAGYTKDYVGTSLFIAPRDTLLDGVTLSRGAQLSRPINLDNNWNARTYASFGRPLLKLKSNLNLSGSVNFNQVPGLVNDALNLSRTWSSTAGITLASNISEKIDFTLGSNFSASRVSTTLQPESNFSFLQYDLSAKGVWMVTKHWMFSSDVTNYTYDGLEGGFNQTFLLWNAGLGYRVGKKNTGELKLSVFDILGQNTAISRQVTDTFIEDSRTQVLTRFFLLSFTYNLRKLASADAEPPAWQGSGGGMRPH